MLAEAVSESKGHELKFIAGEERERIAEQMQHIKDLKPGDKVRWQERMKNSRWPAYGEIVEVFRVFPVRYVTGKEGSPSAANENDFSLITHDNDGDIIEFIYDSRRFERVE